MTYVDGFVLAVPKKQLQSYTKMAKKASQVWLKHGALDYKEAVGDDMNIKGVMPFGKTVKMKPDETVVFSYIVFKSRAHRDKVNAQVMKDPQIQAMEGKAMPFDMKRMAYGGFKTIVEA